MTYETIYSRFYSKITDPDFVKQPEEYINEICKDWLRATIAEPYIHKCFSAVSFDDTLCELDFELNTSIDEFSDEEFVIEILARGMAICWLQQKVDKNTNLAVMVGGKEERTMLNNYKPNVARLREMKADLKKYISSYGYYNNEYIGEL